VSSATEKLQTIMLSLKLLFERADRNQSKKIKRRGLKRGVLRGKESYPPRAWWSRKIRDSRSELNYCFDFFSLSLLLFSLAIGKNYIKKMFLFFSFLLTFFYGCFYLSLNHTESGKYSHRKGR